MASLQDVYNVFQQGQQANGLGQAYGQLSPYFNQNSDLINKYFQSAAGNLSAAQGTAGNQARQNAGALANSYGMLNPGGFTLRAGSQAQAPYVAQQGNLQAQQAGAQVGNYQQLIQAMLGLYGQNRQFDLQQQQLNAQSNPNIFDYLGLGTSILGLPVSGGTSLLGTLLKRGGGSGTSQMGGNWSGPEYTSGGYYG